MGTNGKGSATVEGTRSLDVMALARAGFLSDARDGTWYWTHGDRTLGSIRIRGDKQHISLSYRLTSPKGSQTVEQPVPILWSACRYGGERPWFLCAAQVNGVYCGRRVTKLYAGARFFACRNCYRLGYDVQRMSPINQAHHSLARLYRKLGAEYDRPNGLRPAKPRWMRWMTYERLLQQIALAEDRLYIVFITGSKRLLARTDRSAGAQRRQR